MDVLLQGGEILNFKKCGFLLSLFMMVFFVFPIISSAESNDLVKGKLDGESISNATSKRIAFDSTYSIDSLYVWLKIQTASDATVYIKLYKDNEELVWTSQGLKVRYLGSGYKGDEYNLPVNVKDVKYMEVSSNKAIKILNLKAFGNQYIPEVSDFKAIPDGRKVKLSWENPLASEKVKSTKLYKDGKGIKTFNINENITSHVVDNLEAGKSYSFKMTVIDSDNNESFGITRDVKLSMPVINPPENVFLTPQDRKIVIAWDDVKSPYLQGYNVYVDGKKINDKPLTSNKLIVKNLENDKSYKVQVSAVNKNDVEGEKSKEVSEKPSSDALEVEYDVKMPFDPKDVLGVVMAFLLIVGPLILLGLAIKFYKPIITFLYNSIQKKKRRDEK